MVTASSVTSSSPESARWPETDRSADESSSSTWIAPVGTRGELPAGA
jgi:hypothetical protein